MAVIELALAALPYFGNVVLPLFFSAGRNVSFVGH